MKSKTGVLLINLGTPDGKDAKSVYRYLKEFLNDPFVIDLPGFIRWPLVNFIILPLRYRNSAKLYEKIWSEQGSPLLYNSLKLREAVQLKLEDEFQVEFGMRYGKPSIKEALHKLSACDSIIVLPLFPQYSHAATQSALHQFQHDFKNFKFRKFKFKGVKTIDRFYNLEKYAESFAENIELSLKNKHPEKIIFSFHGLPQRQVDRVCSLSCKHLTGCPQIKNDNINCYRAQCYSSANLIAKYLGLKKDEYIIGFQSRLGRIPWITPYTDKILEDLRADGIKSIAVASPSFVSDCLETLEEINIRLREQWHDLGGEKFHFIPALNDSKIWVNALSDFIREV